MERSLMSKDGKKRTDQPCNTPPKASYKLSPENPKYPNSSANSKRSKSSELFNQQPSKKNSQSSPNTGKCKNCEEWKRLNKNLNLTNINLREFVEKLKSGQEDRDHENANLSEQIYEQECEIRRIKNENESL
jgi:hypothetical protein